MKAFFRITVAIVMMLSFVPGLRAEGFNLLWNNCAAGGGVQNQNFACGSNIGFHSLYASFVPPPGITQVRTITFQIDLLTEDLGYSPWWAIRSIGACRQALTITTALSTEPGCPDAWHGLSTANTSVLSKGFEGTLNHGRLIVTASPLDSMAVGSLDPATEYYGVKLVISNLQTIGSNLCGGCTDKACLVLNSVFINQSGEAPDHLISAVASSNVATWQGDAPGSCVSVPVRNQTWGSIKSLYR